MPQGLQIYRGKIVTRGGQCIVGVTTGCCCTPVNCAFDSTYVGTCASTPPPLEWDVTIPSVAFTTGDVGCESCGNIPGNTFTVNRTTGINDNKVCPPSGGYTAAFNAWIYGSTAFCSVSPTAPASSTTATFGMQLVAGCESTRWSWTFALSLRYPNWFGTGCAGQTWQWKLSGIDPLRDCDTETFYLPFIGASGIGSDLICGSTSSFTGTYVTLQKH